MPSEAEIDAAAKFLRETQQGGKTLTPWSMTPTATKKKWLALARGALSAASAVRSEGVKVRALEWSDNEAETPFGPIYVIHDVTGFLGDARYDLWRKSSAEDDEGVFLDGGFGDWSAAASAAKEHYTNAVLSAITSPVQTREDGIREAAKVAADFTYSHAGAEDENSLVGMFARGSRNAKRKIEAAILALLSQPEPKE